MKLTADNYFSKEMQMMYTGSSQIKSFLRCESAALAEINGEYREEKTTALLVGSYVDRYFEGTLDKFIDEYPEIIVTRGENKGELKSEYKQANTIITRIERDPMFMKYMNGEKQKIMTGKIEGVPVKIKIDSYHPGKAIVDLKIMQNMDGKWKDNTKLNFIEYWQYDVQGAIYQAVEGNHLPFMLAVATKEKEPNIEIIKVNQDRLDFCLEIVKANIVRFSSIKKGKVEPGRCGSCDWCRSTKILTNIIDSAAL